MKKLLLLIVLLATTAYAGAQLPSDAGIVAKERVKADVEIMKAQISPVQKVSPSLKETSRLNKAIIKNENVAQKLKDGSSIYLVELEDGTVVKRLDTPEKTTEKVVSSRTSNLRAAAQTPVVSFSEGFEGWNGEAFDWIPDAWTEESKTGMVATEKQNLTWYTNAGVNDYPTEGFFMASIKVGFINNVETYKQDEWLISPEIQVAEDNRLQFDLCFKPGWVLFDTKTMTFTAKNTTLEVLITTDNGATWTKIWDAIDEAKTFTYSELMKDLQTIYGTWTRNQVDLSAYVGKKVKLAFRFVGTNGESMSLDNILVSPPMPDPLYRHPAGALYMGFNEDYLSLNNTFMLAPAYQDATWYNFSGVDSESFKWSVTDPVSNSLIESTEVDLVTNYPYSVANLPVLTGYSSNGKYASSYQWGTINQDYVQFGGNTTFNVGGGVTVEMGAGNYDIFNEFTIGMLAEHSYLFGSNSNLFWGSQYQVNGIANLFEKPLRKYAFDKIWLHCLDFDAAPDAEIKLTIYRVDNDGVIQEQIASSTCYGGEVTEAFVADGLSYNTIPFTFKVTDPNTGRKKRTWLEIEDAIFVELTGFTSSKVKSFAPCFQALPHPTLDNYAYIYLSYAGSAGDLYSVNGVLPTMFTSFLFGMNAVYPFMLTDDNSFAAPAEGATKEFVITSFYDTNAWKMNNLPEWITVGDAYKNSSEDIVLPVTVSPLGSSGGRSHDIKITTYASDLTLQITQGSGTGIETSTAESLNAVYNDGSFNLTYPLGMNKVSVIDITGKVVAAYNLPSDGRFAMPAEILGKGVYVLKFEGEKNGMIKIMK